MHRLCATLVAGVLVASAMAVRADQEQTLSAIREADLARWFDAVERHTPGFNDPPLETIKSLSLPTLNRIRRALNDRRKALNVESFNRLVHRSAVMHLDAAMALLNEGRSELPPSSRRSRSGATAVLTNDGGFTGLDVTGVHWEYGRMIVDLTLPLPSENDTARLWYVAAASFMANRALLADLAPHLEKGRKLFPADPDLLFISGSYYDAVSSSRIRAVIESADLPRGIHIAAPSSRESLRLAEDYFRRAIDARPDFAAARVRRARLLDLLGRHHEAVRELRDAVSRTADPTLLYYAALFEGAAHEALGDLAAARESYERAATASPNAQSPYLALSRLARDRGDRAAAQAAIAHVFAPETREELDDPWWTYHFWFVRNADAIFTALRQRLVAGPSR